MDPNEVPPSQDNLCKTWDWENKICLECAQRAYFDENGVCAPVSNHCQTWDQIDGLCLTCYEGYDLEEGKCVWSPEN